MCVCSWSGTVRQIRQDASTTWNNNAPAFVGHDDIANSDFIENVSLTIVPYVLEVPPNALQRRCMIRGCKINTLITLLNSSKLSSVHIVKWDTRYCYDGITAICKRVPTARLISGWTHLFSFMSFRRAMRCKVLYFVTQRVAARLTALPTPQVASPCTKRLGLRTERSTCTIERIFATHMFNLWVFWCWFKTYAKHPTGLSVNTLSVDARVVCR